MRPPALVVRRLRYLVRRQVGMVISRPRLLVWRLVAYRRLRRVIGRSAGVGKRTTRWWWYVFLVWDGAGEELGFHTLDGSSTRTCNLLRIARYFWFFAALFNETTSYIDCH